MRPTVADIAREAGVSTATVDRVLHNRAGSYSRSRERVLEAAMRLGYAAPTSDAAPVTGAARRARLDFVLPDGANSFMLHLERELRTQAALRGDIECRFHLVNGFDAEALAGKLNAIGDQTEGIGLIAIDHPAVRDAIRRAVRSGVKVVTLVSDLQNVPRAAYIGIDNRSAGRLSAYLLARFLGQGRHKLALFAGSVAYRGHEEREMGFRHALSEHSERLEIVGFAEVRDDDERAHEAALDHLRRIPDLSAIYNIGAGNRGIARAIQKTGRASEVVFIGHDLTDDTRDHLLSGVMDVVIDQNARVEARDALEQLSRAVRNLPPNAHPIRIGVICRENIPDERW